MLRCYWNTQAERAGKRLKRKTTAEIIVTVWKGANRNEHTQTILLQMVSLSSLLLDINSNPCAATYRMLGPFFNPQRWFGLILQPVAIEQSVCSVMTLIKPTWGTGINTNIMCCLL